VVNQAKSFLSRNRRKVVPAAISLSLLAGLITSIVVTQGAQADYYVGCGYGYNANAGGFGYNPGNSTYGYGYNGPTFGYGNGEQVCPPPPSTGGTGGGGGATTTTSSTTSTTTTLTTTTTQQTTTTTLRKKPTPRLLGLHVYFANDSAVITSYYKGLLNALAAEIVADHTGHVTITGYASEIGTPAINQPLSLLRAQTVKAYLEAALKARGYSSISFTVSGNGVLRAYPNLALDRVVVITG
jgi:outer membrane protein OmpA-like peptidoglycan-associated protein